LDLIAYQFNVASGHYVVTLTLLAALADGNYTLTVSPALVDTAGNHLGGNAAGGSGSAYLLPFAVGTPQPGAEFGVNQTTAGDQQSARWTVAAAADGRSIVTWTSPDGSGAG